MRRRSGKFGSVGRIKRRVGSLIGAVSAPETRSCRPRHRPAGSAIASRRRRPSEPLLATLALLALLLAPLLELESALALLSRLALLAGLAPLAHLASLLRLLSELVLLSELALLAHLRLLAHLLGLLLGLTHL